MGKYFTLAELTASREAAARGIDNTPPPQVRQKLCSLITSLLDPVREAWGGPIAVNSGFRSPELNRAVGGAAMSQHIRGEAADITAGSRSANRRLFSAILSGGFPFDQLIWEKGDATGPDWIHVSYNPAGGRRQVIGAKL